MLSKPVGATGLFALTSTPGVFTATTTEVGTYKGVLNASIPAHKVRIAVASQPAVINFGKTANNNSDILIPANTVEHFALTTVTTVTFVLATGAGGNGTISITPVA